LGRAKEEEMVEKSRAESATGSVIGKTVTFEGDLQFSGTLFVAGRVIGNIASDSMEYAHLVIGSGGVVEGNIDVPELVVEGEVTGTITAKRLEILSDAVIGGDIQYLEIEMASGALLNGNLIYSADRWEMSLLKLVEEGDSKGVQAEDGAIPDVLQRTRD
jgi:cytoskeletal protein CcmA (bactofilin family)